MKNFLPLIATLVMCSPASACDGLEITDAWVREAPPGAGVLAGYAALKNTGKQALLVDGAKGADFDAVELHRTVMENGQMRMLGDQKISLPPGASVKLEPGALHLMLMRPRRLLKSGDQIDLSLSCGGSARVARFVVRAER